MAFSLGMMFWLSSACALVLSVVSLLAHYKAWLMPLSVIVGWVRCVKWLPQVQASWKSGKH